MESFLLILVALTAGYLLKRKYPDTQGHVIINQWILNIALPACTFYYLPKVQWSSDMIFPIVGSMIVLLSCSLYLGTLQKPLGLNRNDRASLTLGSAYSNTSFVGFPLITALYGEEYLSIAIIVDQVNFLLVSTFGIVRAISGGGEPGQKVELKYVVNRLARFVPFWTCIIVLSLGQWIPFGRLDVLWSKLAATIAPMALFSVGLQLNFKGIWGDLKFLTIGLFYKLLLAPTILLLIALGFGFSGMIAKITIIEAAMPTLITSSIIAQQYKLNSEWINRMIGVSILLSLGTTYVWKVIMEYVL